MEYDYIQIPHTNYKVVSVLYDLSPQNDVWNLEATKLWSKSVPWLGGDKYCNHWENKLEA